MFRLAALKPMYRTNETFVVSFPPTFCLKREQIFKKGAAWGGEMSNFPLARGR